MFPTPRHPKALYPLALTEFWERYGFYVVQALLVIVITHIFHQTDSSSVGLVGSFIGLAYLSPLLGGYLADKVYGYRLSIIMGALLLAISYIFIAQLQLHLIYLGLSILVVGNGFLKPNISSFLGTFYPDKSPLRDAGFTLFYVGINIGAILAMLLVDPIQNHFGLSLCFYSSAVALLIGLVVFMASQSFYEQRGHIVKTELVLPKFLRLLKNPIVAILFILALVALCYTLLSGGVQGDLYLLASIVVLIISMVIILRSYAGVEKKKLIALFFLVFIAIFFWAAFFQLFTLVSLFIDRLVDHHLLGLTLGTPGFLAFEPCFVIVIGMILAPIWQRRSDGRAIDGNVGYKFSLAFMLSAFSLLILVFAIFIDSSHQISAWWMVLFFFIFTLGEMLISPIGLSIVTALSPKRISGGMMGVWFLSLGYGGSLAGVFSQLGVVVSKDIHNKALLLTIYSRAFLEMAGIVFVVGLIAVAYSPTIKRLILSSEKRAPMKT